MELTIRPTIVIEFAYLYTAFAIGFLYFTKQFIWQKD